MKPVFAGRWVKKDCLIKRHNNILGVNDFKLTQYLILTSVWTWTRYQRAVEKTGFHRKP